MIACQHLGRPSRGCRLRLRLLLLLVARPQRRGFGASAARRCLLFG
eukprot:SAG31_NODE_35738_length_320_cov_0.932127_2_plen_45_part_01